MWKSALFAALAVATIMDAVASEAPSRQDILWLDRYGPTTATVDRYLKLGRRRDCAVDVVKIATPNQIAGHLKNTFHAPLVAGLLSRVCGEVVAPSSGRSQTARASASDLAGMSSFRSCPLRVISI